MIFNYSKWLALPINTRHDIAQKLGIIKKTPTHVQDNVIVSDGYNIKDVESALTVEGLQTYLGVGIQETDFEVLWEMLLTPSTVTLDEVIAKQSPEVQAQIPVEMAKIKRKGGRPKGAKNKTVL